MEYAIHHIHIESAGTGLRLVTDISTDKAGQRITSQVSLQHKAVSLSRSTPGTVEGGVGVSHGVASQTASSGEVVPRRLSAQHCAALATQQGAHLVSVGGSLAVRLQGLWQQEQGGTHAGQQVRWVRQTAQRASRVARTSCLSCDAATRVTGSMGAGAGGVSVAFGHTAAAVLGSGADRALLRAAPAMNLDTRPHVKRGAGWRAPAWPPRACGAGRTAHAPKPGPGETRKTGRLAAQGPPLALQSALFRC